MASSAKLTATWFDVMPSSNRPRVLKKTPQIVVVRAVPGVDLGQFPVASLRDFIVLTRQHARRCGQPADNDFLCRQTIVVFGECGESFDNGVEHGIDRRRRVQIINVADGFEAFTECRQDVDVLSMRPRKL